MAAEVTLTFDNGPDPGATPHVLDVLAARGLHATFFVVGEKLAAARALSERAHAEGHWIGNHTWTHRAPFGELDDTCAPHAEIERTQELIGPLAHPDRLFRPVGGGGALGPHVLTPETVEVLTAGGYTCVLWSAVPGDWKDPDGWVERALEQCRDRRALLVLHDLPTGAMTHLERFLDSAAAEGMTFTQQLPAACVPIRRGEVVRPLGALGG